MDEAVDIKTTTHIRVERISYWVFTAIIVLETAAGAQWDLARNPTVVRVFNHLGYPLYLLAIIGIWKIPGAVVLLIPKFSQLKEWAYAGIFFIYTTATVSAFLKRDNASIWGPFTFAVIALASYYLRPASRRLGLNQHSSSKQQKQNTKNKKLNTISYWATVVILGYVLISGGIGEILHLWGTLGTITRLGYPMYFLAIIGIWKILGGITIIIPGFPRLKEWAYAGIVFNMTGASLSHAACHDYGPYAFHIIAPLIIAVIAIASWALRPANRRFQFSGPKFIFFSMQKNERKN